MVDDIISNERIMGAVSYVGALFFIPLFTTARRSDFVRFHVRQGFLLFVVELVVGWVPVIGWAVMMACVIASIVGAINALQGRRWEVPILGKYARLVDI